MKHILTFDIGGTDIKHALIQEDGTILSQSKVATPYQDQEAFFKVLDQVKDSYQEIIDGVAISMPGTIDSESGYVFQGGSLTYNSKTNIKTLLNTRWNLPVEIENDARSATIAEMTKGNLAGIKNGVVLTFGTGVGGCFVLNNEIYKGSHLFSGEVSMVITKDIQKEGLNAVWGNQSSVPALIKHVCEAKQCELVDGKTLFQWIEEKDEIACSYFQKYCYDIVIQLFNIQVSFDPQRVCIGGGISANPLFVQTLNAVMDQFYASLPIAMPKLEILPCKFHNNANLLGAFYHFMNMQK